MSRTKFWVPTTKVKVEGQTVSNYKLCVLNNSKTSEGNLIKINTTLKHNEKMFRAQNLGFFYLGQGHSYRLLIRP